jgi:hypothetical protein
MKIEIDHSIRAYDGAYLVWHRKVATHGPGYRIQPGPWYIVKVDHEQVRDE